MKNMHTHTYT